MLSVRLAVVTAAAGLCLWGLFSLLDTLKQPALLRSAKATIVKGCDSLESEDAARLCPALLCEKALLDAAAVGKDSRFAVTVDKPGETKQRLVGGDAVSGSSAPRQFACVVDGIRIVASRVLEAGELDELAAQTGGWSL